MFVGGQCTDVTTSGLAHRYRPCWEGKRPTGSHLSRTAFGV